MKILPVGIVFGPEFFELLNNLVISANLLVDDKQHRVEGQHCPQNDSRNFGFHNGPLQVPKREDYKREETVDFCLLSSGSCRLWYAQARAGTVSAQVSTAVRMASSE